ncbi:MAG: energy transducer TonB [Bacteroidota bacterium]
MILPKYNPAEQKSSGMKVSFKKPQKADPFQTFEMVDFLINAKKYRHQKFLASKSLAFSIGLFLSCLSVVILFEWKTYERAGELDVAGNTELFDEVLDIPITQQPPPPPQKKLQQPNIIETVDEIIEEIEIDFDVEITQESVVETVDTEGMDLGDVMEEEVADEIFDIVEFQPQPQGGLQAFMAYVSENINYPNQALRTKVQGKVFVQFVVNKDGTLGDFKVVKGIGAGCDEEAIRVLKNAPKWIPGKQRGKPVRVRMMVPVFFMLRER